VNGWTWNFSLIDRQHWLPGIGDHLHGPVKRVTGSIKPAAMERRTAA